MRAVSIWTTLITSRCWGQHHWSVPTAVSGMHMSPGRGRFISENQRHVHSHARDVWNERIRQSDGFSMSYLTLLLVDGSLQCIGAEYMCGCHVSTSATDSVQLSPHTFLSAGTQAPQSPRRDCSIHVKSWHSHRDHCTTMATWKGQEQHFRS